MQQLADRQVARPTAALLVLQARPLGQVQERRRLQGRQQIAGDLAQQRGVSPQGQRQATLLGLKAPLQPGQCGGPQYRAQCPLQPMGETAGQAAPSR
ncbi:hypothetical protein D3C72_1373510 [compost metagenome]